MPVHGINIFVPVSKGSNRREFTLQYPRSELCMYLFCAISQGKYCEWFHCRSSCQSVQGMICFVLIIKVSTRNDFIVNTIVKVRTEHVSNFVPEVRHICIVSSVMNVILLLTQ